MIPQKNSMRLVRGIWEVFHGGAYWLAYMLGGHFFRRGLLGSGGKRVKIAPTAFLKYPGNISIGDDSFINHHCCVWASPGGKISIGRDVILGPNVCITSSNHGIELGEPIRMQPGKDAPITIGDDVWIGANAVVTAGVTIGDGCVVGAGAVVTRSLPAYAICAGIPARVVRMRSAATREREELPHPTGNGGLHNP